MDPYLTVAHLLQNLDAFARNRDCRDHRPVWLTRLIDELVDLFEPLEGIARPGYRCAVLDNRWALDFYLGETEQIGGARDGETTPVNFDFDIAAFLDKFERVDRMTWRVLAEPVDDHEAWRDAPGPFSLIAVDALRDGHPLRVSVYSLPPSAAGPALKRYSDGRCMPV